MNKKYLRFALWFLIIWFGVNLFFSPKDKAVDTQFVFQTTKPEYAQGTKVELAIQNKFPYAVTFHDECPGEPFAVTRALNGTEQVLTAEAEHMTCVGGEKRIESGQKLTIDYAPWNQELFFDVGTYSIAGDFARADAVPGTAQPTVIKGAGPAPDRATEPVYHFTANFEITERGFFSSAMLRLFYQPVYNFLVFLMQILPGHNVGLAIILLTIVIRLILYIPTLHSLKSQRELQELQPKLQALREKHKGDQQKLAQETMALYKEHGVNPFGSCLPILIQMPFLFAVFYVLRTGLDPSNIYLLYGPLTGFDLSLVQTHFLSFDMTIAEPFMDPACGQGITCFNPRSLVMPFLVGGLQGVSSWLTVRRTKKAQQHAVAQPKATDAAAAQQKMMNVMMTVFIPIMIAWFSFLYPTGLSLYWATTTAFSIGQQMYLEKRKSRAKVVKH